MTRPRAGVKTLGTTGPARHVDRMDVCDDIHFGSTHRWGYGFIEGLAAVLVSRYRLEF